ncbi:nitrate reductase molybdenum cofactor assembly chaperone, partial [Roseovarius sp. D22-M7]|uniref:nitrate reductase molybdenum cofactor assembly chaperone n=1 Tax=Roseovarius sp. D22-M7 TaxID=3127116 RepID=UPI0030104ED3
MMDRTLKALSLLLSYPTVELQAGMPEIGAAVTADARLTPALRDALRPLLARLAQGDIYDVQEDYVMLFDRSRTLSLNLFEHVHGESRDRGGAMVSLMETYRAAGFEPATTELPDHLPVLLEYLATRPAAEVEDVLQDAAHILAAIEDRLTRRESLYAPLFPALIQLAHGQADSEAVAELLAEPDDDPT